MKINKIQFVLLFIVLLIVVIPSAEARLTERIGVFLDYNSIDKKISISNILNKPIVELTLLENGCALTDCSALIKINSKFDLDLSTLDYYFIDFFEEKGKLERWDWEWYYMENETYNYTYDCVKGQRNTTLYFPSNNTYTFPKQDIVGTCSEMRTEKKQIKIDEKKDFIDKSKDYYIKLRGKLELNSRVEWIPTFYGIKLTEWAWWNSDYQYRIPIYFNVTAPETVYNITRLANGTVGIDTQGLITANKMDDTCLDINFADVNGNLLGWDWDASRTNTNYGCNKTGSLIWVRLPNITSTGFTAYMYYGNISTATATNSSKMAFWDMVLAMTFGEGSGVPQDKSPMAQAVTGGGSNIWKTSDCGFGNCWNSTANADQLSVADAASLDLDVHYSMYVYANITKISDESMGTMTKFTTTSWKNGEWWWFAKDVSSPYTVGFTWVSGAAPVGHNVAVTPDKTMVGYGLTYNASQLTQYVNKTQINATSTTGNLTSTTTSPIKIGGSTALINVYGRGDYKIIFIWNYSLSIPELAQYYADIANSNTGAEEIPTNTAPEIQNIAITPSTAYTNSTLNCSASYADADSNKGNVSIMWYNGSSQYSVATILNVVASAIVSNETLAGIQAKDEVWNCSINATDSAGSVSALSSTTRTISNSPPEITSAVVMNVTSANMLISQINCSFNHTDADPETLTDHFRWYVNDVFLGNTTSTITNKTFANGDVLICEGWVSDATPTNSSLSNSTSLTIQSNPIITTATITPATAYTNSTLNCSGIYTDVDADKGNVSITWHNGSTYYSTATKLDILNNRMVSQELTAGIQFKNEKWNCTINATDATDLPSTLVNATITITNTPPEVTAVNLNPSSGVTKLTIGVNATATWQDVDGDSVTFTYKWYNNTNQKAIAGATTQNITNSSFNKNNQLVAEVYVNDGTDNSNKVNSSSITVSNSAPIFGTLTLTPSANIYKTTIGINCTGTATDADSDILTPKWRWYLNDVASSQTQNITNSTYSKNNNLICMAWFYDDDKANTTLINSSQITILNSIPTIDSTVVINETTAYKTTSQINSSYNASDADSDTLTYYYRWYKNNVLINTTSLLTNRSYSKNDVLIAEGWTMDDVPSNSTLVNSSSLTISNSAPSVPVIGNPVNATRTTGNSVTLNCDGSTDPDSDTVRYVFYGDATPTATTVLQNDTATTYAWTTTDGSTYYWRCKAEDNAGGVSGFTAEKTFTENTPPTVSAVAINPSTAYTNGTLNCSANFSDAESDKLNVTLTWYNGSASYSSASRLNIISTSTNNSFLLTDGIQAVGEKWNCSVNPYDSYENGTSLNATITISNSPPFVSVYAPINLTNTTDNTPDFIFNYTDTDLTLGNCILYVNATNVGSNSATVSGVNTTITSSALTDGANQQWYVNCSDGTSTTQSEIRVIGIDASSPVLTISQPSGEYFTYGLPYENLPINFSYVEASPDSCWYRIDYSNGLVNTTSTSICNFGNGCSFANDNNWNTFAYGNENPKAITENYTNPYSGGSATFITKWNKQDSYNYSFSCWDYTSNSYSNISTPVSLVDTDVPDDCIGAIVSIRVDTGAGGASAFSYYEQNITFFSSIKVIIPICQNTTINTSLSGNHTLYLFMNDTFGNEGSSSSSFSINLLNASSSASKGNVSESEQVTFTLQINSTNITSINATFYYNNTAYNYGTRQNSTYQANITRVFNIPFGMGNMSYYWNYTINSHNNVTSKYNLTVHNMSMGLYSSSFARAVNFSIYDERNRSLIYGDFKGNFIIWTDDKNINKTFLFDITNKTNFTFGIAPAFGNYSYDLIGEYKSTSYLNQSSYVIRPYYVENGSMDNITEEVELYNLETIKSTTFIQKVQDINQFAVTGALILIQRYYPEIDSYKTVQISRTDDVGEATGFYEVENALYRHIVIKKGITLLTTGRQNIIAKTTPYTITLTIGGEFVYPWKVMENLSSLEYSLKFNNKTRIVTFYYSDTSGLFINSSMYVYWQIPSKGDVLICSTNSTSSSATLTCDLSAYSTGTWIAKVYITRDVPYFIYLIRFFITTVPEDMGQAGLFLAFFIILVMGFAFIWHPIAGSWGIVVSLIFINLMGIASFSPIYIWGAIAVAIIITIVMKS